MLISRRLGQLWKSKRNKFRRPRRTRDRTESSGQKKTFGNEAICFECKEPGHYRNDCPKLKKDKKPKKGSKGRKGLMATWDDSESEDEASDEEHANMALMAGASGYVSESGHTTDEEFDSDDEAEVIASLSRSKLEFCFSEAMKRYQLLKSDHKILKRKFEITSETFTKSKHIIADLNEKLLTFEKSNLALKSKISKLEEDIVSSKSVTDEVIRYDRAFQYFLAKGIDRSKMASMIYGVSRNGRKGLGYSGSSKQIDETLVVKPRPLSEHFVPYGTELECSKQDSSSCSKSQ